MSRVINLLARAVAALALIAAVFAAIFYLVSNHFFGFSIPGWAVAGVWIGAVLAIYHYLVAPAVRPYDQAWRAKRRARTGGRVDG